LCSLRTQSSRSIRNFTPTDFTPLRFSFPTIFYHEFIERTFAGAVPLPNGGFECPGLSPIDCYGYTGQQVLNSLSYVLQLHIHVTPLGRAPYTYCNYM
jgi:hypothetical protein